MIGVYHTSHPPVRQFVDKLQALEEQDDGVLSISLGHGFPWGDVADMGTRAFLVVTELPPRKEGHAPSVGLC